MLRLIGFILLTIPRGIRHALTKKDQSVKARIGLLFNPFWWFAEIAEQGKLHW